MIMMGEEGWKRSSEEFDFNKRKGNGNYNNDYEERIPNAIEGSNF